MTRLMSFCTRPTVAAKSAVMAPTGDDRQRDRRQFEHRRQAATMNTPAVTMVAAWISAETGVGPSIASGSQVCRQELRRLAHRADEQQQADSGERHPSCRAHAEEGRWSCRSCPGPAKIGVESTSSRTPEHAEDAEREAEIADAVDDEGLDRGGIGLGFLYQKPISR
jgi:hypothetical protein